MAVAVVLWFMLGSTGILSDVEGFVGELLGYENFHFLGWRILQFTILLGLLWVVSAAAVTAGLVLLYNRASAIVGGIQVETTEAPASERRPATEGRPARERRAQLALVLQRLLARIARLRRG
jgi:hypothetical protein